MLQVAKLLFRSRCQRSISSRRLWGFPAGSIAPIVIQIKSHCVQKKITDQFGSRLSRERKDWSILFGTRSSVSVNWWTLVLATCSDREKKKRDGLPQREPVLGRSHRLRLDHAPGISAPPGDLARQTTGSFSWAGPFASFAFQIRIELLSVESWKERQQGNKKKITQIWMVLHVRDRIKARLVQYFHS
jgi:hypothetical protein